MIAALGAVPGLPLEQAEAGPCDPPMNPIVCENSKPGSPPSEWQIDGAGDADILGFATDISVDQGQTVGFKVDTDAADYRVDIYRLGYYDGQGARRVDTIQPSAALPQQQPPCLNDATTGLVDCGNWGLSASWTVPADAVSGIYIAKPQREDGTSGSSHIVFVVRDDDGESDVLFQTSDTTWQAYNRYGGSSLYVGSPAGRAHKVSYNRPFTTRGCCAEDWLFNAEYPMVRFMERNGYDVSYSTGVDTDRLGPEILEHDAFLSVGHDEYWSGQQRSNVEAARAAGVHMAFLSGNEVFWKTRWEPSIDGSSTAHRTLVSYKETHDNAKIDPTQAWTGTWADPRFSPPADGGHPQNALTGQQFTVNCCTYAMNVPAADGRLRFWRNTSLANLPQGQTATLPDGTLGYEWDSDVDNGFRPSGLINMSSTTVNVPQKLQDWGSTYDEGSATHKLTLYRHPSGALVFGAGTVQWSWGLDSTHDRGSEAPDQRMQQATVNLFADMGFQPDTLESGLVASSASTDSTAPSSAVTAPNGGASVVRDDPVAISGTASDTGGVVGGVEVSTDGGETWHPAAGREAWSYSWVPSSPGSYQIISRATDDSGNIGVESAPISVTVTDAPCPCTIWSGSATPDSVAEDESSAVELGVKFRASEDGFITGLRFYKGSGNNGTHTGHLWSASGNLLSSATFTGESASGWQQVHLSAPVPVSAGTTYVASYHAPSGHYAFDQNYFTDSGTTRGPLTALRNGTDGPNGVYRYGSSGFPTNSFSASNYWVDVVFNTDGSDTSGPTITARSPQPNSSGAPETTNVSATFNEDVVADSIDFELRDAGDNLVAAPFSYNPTTRTARLNPNNDLIPGASYSATVSGATDLNGNQMQGTHEWSFTISVGCPCTIWDPSTVPDIAAEDEDTSAVELGVKFKPSSDGFITGIRFFKGLGNGGVHTGSLWSRDGVRLANVTFTGETAEGWQEATFDNAVSVTADTTYIASYHAPQGRYSVDDRYFVNGGFERGPLKALGDGEDGPNSIYRYGTSAFPTSSYRATNYWVDVVFESTSSDSTPPTVVGTSPVPGATNVPITTNATATFSESIDESSIQFELRRPNGTQVPAAVSYDNVSRTAMLDPSADLERSTSYTVVLGGVRDLAGNEMAGNETWSFTTSASLLNCPCSVWNNTDTPTVASDSDGSPVEVGVKFRADVDGFITGLRFYKGPQNTGTHIGHLWSGSGQLLGAARFLNETQTGWQQVVLDAPVPVTSGTTYIASYHAPSGNYALDQDYFSTSDEVSGPLRALRDGFDGFNGVYTYGPNGSFPTDSHEASNYWVDVVFDTEATDTLPPRVQDRIPSAGDVEVDLAANVTATFGEPVEAGSMSFELRDSGGNLVPASVNYDPSTLTATLNPTNALASLTSHEASISAVDLAGNAMAESDEWTFTTLEKPPPFDDDGPGGPVLVVTDPSRPFSSFYTEILRNEGLNEFRAIDIGSLNAANLAGYDVAILGEMPLSAPQVSLFDDWVRAGGNLIAMRPDKQLASLLGLSDLGTTLSEGYMKVDISGRPGFGITPDTMQYHGTADRYALAGATEVAALYANATTSTTNPAVTVRDVGTNDGQAAAFTYDLARSVVQTRQGNPAWAGQERDGINPIRSDDLYFGGMVPDWIDLSKVAIPQADEQQRLLINTINHVNSDNMPLPRFWYLPFGEKAAVVMTGDDHSNGGTKGRFDAYKAASPPNCSVEQWECVRSTTYVYPNAPLSDEDAALYSSQGFEVALHVSTGCSNYTRQSLGADATEQLNDFAEEYPSVPVPTTNRTHCIVWSDWATHAEVESLHGIRLDTNYYYYPGPWVQNRPGFMTGSGMPMRFADTDGSAIDVYQAATQLTDESGQSYPAHINTLLDNALGAPGYYGVFTANMHTDEVQSPGSDAIVDSATSRGVPIVSARQMLEWIDARNSSSFASVGWNGNRLSFSVNRGAGATGLQAMVPVESKVGPLTTITRQGQSIPFEVETIKGVDYALFDAVGGAYEATFSSDATAPVISQVAAQPGASSTAQVTWTTNEPSDSTVDYGTSPTSLNSTAQEGSLINSHQITLSDLQPGATYYYRVVSADATGNVARSPAPPAAPASFSMPLSSLTDATVLHFSQGTGDGSNYISETGDGEVMLAPQVGAEFTGSSLPTAWTSSTWKSGGSVSVGGGRASVDAALARTAGLYDPGKAMEFVATFTGAPYQHAGFGVTLSAAPWAIFSTNGGNQLWARTAVGTAQINTPIPGSWLGSPHRFRIEWTPSAIDYYVDGTRVATHSLAITAQMRPLASDLNVGGGSVLLDWLRMSPFATTGSFTSRVMDAGGVVDWVDAVWAESLVADNSLTLSIRKGDTPTPDGSWTAFQNVSNGGSITGSSRYIQYRVNLATTDPTRSPVLQEISLRYGS